MPIHNNGVETKSVHPSLVHFNLVLKSCRLALAQAVHIKDSHKVVKLVVAGEGGSLPYTSLGTLTITHYAEHTVARGGREKEGGREKKGEREGGREKKERKGEKRAERVRV
jgi:hypothetical protein